MINIRKANFTWEGITIPIAEVHIDAAYIPDISGNIAKVHYTVNRIYTIGETEATQKLFEDCPEFEYTGGDLRAEAIEYLGSMFGLQ